MLVLIRPRGPKPPCWQGRFGAGPATTIIESPETLPVVVADKDLKQRVVSYLHLRHVLDVQTLRIDVQRGQVTVHGRLPSPEAKRLCLECCRRVAGVLQLKDEVDITAIRDLD